jgi:predicted secreted hydrolase
MNMNPHRSLKLWLQCLCLGGLLGLSCKAEDFSVAQPGRTFVFPRDHGSHPEFRTEWWYVTGHLDGSNGQRFGFQATFFRQAQPDGEQIEHLYLAHAALLDAKTDNFISEEKLNREGWDAASSTTQLDVRNSQWSLRMIEGSERLKLSITVRADAALELELTPSKPLVIFGKDGVSRKGSSPNAASHYLTFPRLQASGTVRVGPTSHAVTGEAWMDHEFSSSQLDEGQVGWDWAALHLHDGREVMVYRMRREDGLTDAASTLAIVGADGKLDQRPRDAFEWKALGSWPSPHTKATYPNHVRISTGGESFELRPLANDQEQGGSLTGLPYWEGACDVLDAKGKVIGRAFLELAGYAGDLRRHLGNP